MGFSWENKILVTIPTYNEKLTIRKIVEEIFNLYPKVNICIVDDNSPDGTAEIIKNLEEEYRGKLFLIKRSGKFGRGGAVLAGFKFGLQSNYEYFIEMDSDFSHQPKEIKRIMEQSDTCDVVVGSRYLQASRIVNWPFKRRVFSFCVNFLIRSLLQIPIKDYTNGFRCYSRKAVSMLDFDSIQGSGFIVLSSMAYQLHWKGFSFAEVPTLFIDRTLGSSNFTIREIKDAFLAIWKIKKSCFAK